MACYVIGDVHGCYEPLSRLLAKISYSPHQDRILFIGDLVGRGRQSLEVLRHAKSLCSHNGALVLGNHDLHLIALFLKAPAAASHPDPSLARLLEAEDCAELIDWLRHQPLALYENAHQCLLVHAGVPPIWTQEQALLYAAELETALHSDRAELRDTLNSLYGDEPSRWSDSLVGSQRLRLIANYLTRMRLCNQQGDLLFEQSEEKKKANYKPWLDFPRADSGTIIFGHWAALGGKTRLPHIIGLDYGCVWGHSLAALRLDDGVLFRVAAR